METPPAGAVVLVPFPFSDLSESKRRPAIVVADVGRGDFVMCQVTSRPYGDERAYRLDQAHFADGGLRVASFARPGKLFTGHHDLILGQVGRLTSRALADLVEKIVALLRSGAGSPPA